MRVAVSGIQIVFEFQGFMFLFILDFGTSNVALFNGLTISDIRTLVLHVYYLHVVLPHLRFLSKIKFNTIFASFSPREPLEKLENGVVLLNHMYSTGWAQWPI